MKCPEDIAKHFPEKWKCCGEPQFYIKEGWLKPILECHEKLKALSPKYEIHQVKEKFGGLRYYIDYNTGDEFTRKAMNEVIAEAEEKCATACEVCGELGQPVIVNKRYITTVCDEHRPEGSVIYK